MAIYRTFFNKVKPGRMQDTLTQISEFKRVCLESRASYVRIWNVLTGPLFPEITTTLT